jgi:hypothetical protein
MHKRGQRPATTQQNYVHAEGNLTLVRATEEPRPIIYDGHTTASQRPEQLHNATISTAALRLRNRTTGVGQRARTCSGGKTADTYASWLLFHI